MALEPSRWPPVFNTVICFAGWGHSEAGDRFEPGGQGTSGTQQLLNMISKIQPGDGSGIRPFGWNGSLRDGYDEAATVIQSNFHPLGRLIITGFSAGGGTAIRLAAWLSRMVLNLTTNSWHGFSTVYEAIIARNTISLPRVDLLCTVDIASGPLSDFESREIPGSVRRNVNMFQIIPDLVGSHGGLTSAQDPRTQVVNRDWTSSDVRHHNIDEHAMKLIANEVRTLLDAR